MYTVFTVPVDAADLGPVTTPQLQSGYRGAAERLQSDGSEGERKGVDTLVYLASTALQ